MNIFDLIPVNSAKPLSLRGLLLGVSLIAIGGVASAQTLVTNNGALISITTGATVIVKNASVHNSTGYISNAGSFTIEQNLVNDDTMSGGGARGLYRVHDNWVNNHDFIPDNSTVELYGDNEQITGTAVTTYYNLNLTGTGIKTQTLNANVLDTLSLNDRELATEHYKMHVLNTDPSAVTKAAGNLGYVSSLDSGRLAWDLDRNAPYLYPTGSSLGVARYRPVQIRPNLNNNQTVEIRMANNDATVDGFDRSLRDSNICKINDKFYHLIGSNTTDQVQVSFFYDAGLDGLWYILTNWQGAKWSDVGNTVPASSPPFSVLTRANWNGFSNEPFAFGRPNPTINPAVATTNLRCYNDSSGTITVSTTGGVPPLIYHWSSNDTTLNITHAAAGTYYLTVTDTVGCAGGPSGPFVLTQPPQIHLADSVTNILCNGLTTGSLTVLVDSAVLPISSYHWSINADSTSNSIHNVAAGTYDVTVTDANGCQNKLTENITEPDAIDVADNTHELNCFQSGDGSIALTVTGGTTGSPAYNYQWSDSSTVNQGTRTGLAAGTYTVTITDRNGCKDSSSFTVTQPDSLSLMASADTTIAIGYSAQLDVLSTNGGTGSLTYAWTPTENVTTPTSASTVVTPTNTTTYTVTGTDANGCKTFDTVRVRVDSNLVTVPDGFIPDGNNAANHTFHLLTSTTVEVVELKIFNRWGQLISSSTNGWDGTYNGKPQPMDTYVYQATIRLPNGSNMQKSGDFVLIR